MNLTLTPQFDGESLCVNCRAAHVVKGLRFRDDATYCMQTNRLRRMPVIRFCNRFDDKRVASLYDMQQIAWQLVSDRTRSKIGFISAQEWQQRQGAPSPVQAPMLGHDNGVS